MKLPVLTKSKKISYLRFDVPISSSDPDNFIAATFLSEHHKIQNMQKTPDAILN